MIENVTFNRKDSSQDGLQPWCRRCQQAEKRWARNGWFKFRAVLDQTGERRLWTPERYRELMGDFRCATCGADVTEWSTGYWVDRISSARGYLPSNCRPCCWGCNRVKSNRNPESFEHDIKALVARYGWGKIPWDAVDPHIKHTHSTLPDLTAYIVPPRKRQLAMTL